MADKEPQLVTVDVSGIALGVFLGLVLFSLLAGTLALASYRLGWW